jgi:hypothetical protein
MYLIVISYAIQAGVALIITLCFAHFNSKGDGDLEFSYCEKCMGCLCKTLPMTVRIFTIFGFFLIVYLCFVAFLPQCPRDAGTGFILSYQNGNKPCYTYMAMADQYLGNAWISFRRFLEEYEDDCRGSYGALVPVEQRTPLIASAQRGAFALKSQAAASLVLISSQLALGFAAATKLRPPAWLWDPIPKNEGLLKKVLRNMGP